MQRGAKWRPSVVAFADMMEARLAAKDAERGGNSWPVCDAGDLFDALERNANELGGMLAVWSNPELFVEAVDNPRAFGIKGHDGAAIMAQAADVANFAMMVADRCGPLAERQSDPWLPVTNEAKNGDVVWLLVDYRGEGDHPLSDAEFSATIGFNTLQDTGEDQWKFAGWCWTHDHFVQGKGHVLGWKPIGFALEPRACFTPTPDGANPPADCVSNALREKH